MKEDEYMRVKTLSGVLMKLKRRHTEVNNLLVKFVNPRLRNIANIVMTQCYFIQLQCIEAAMKGREGLQFEINLISKSPGHVKKCEEQFYFDVSLERTKILYGTHQPIFRQSRTD